MIEGHTSHLAKRPLDESDRERKKKKSNRGTSFLGGLLLSIIILFIVALALFSYGIYRYNWQGDLTRKIVSFLPYPAANVDGVVIKLSDYFDELDMINDYYSTIKSKNPEVLQGLEPIAQRKENALDDLIDEAVLVHLANKYKLDISQDFIQKSYDEIVEGIIANDPKVSTREAFQKELESIFGWTEEEHKENVVKNTIIENELREAVNADSEINKEVIEKINEIKGKINEDASNFADLANEYSDDASGGGGNLGSFKRGMMVPEFDDVAFNLETGQVSDPFVTLFGWHLVKVDDKKTVGDEEQLTARHILLKTKPLKEYVEEYKEQLNIKKYINP